MLKQVHCPTCRRSTQWEGNRFRPFCSERCKMHDLGNWALEKYRIPGATIEIQDNEDSGEDSDR